MRDVRLEEILLVQDGVDKIGVSLDLMDEAGVDDLQDHPENFLQDANIGDGLAQRRVIFKT